MSWILRPQEFLSRSVVFVFWDCFCGSIALVSTVFGEISISNRFLVCYNKEKGRRGRRYAGRSVDRSRKTNDTPAILHQRIYAHFPHVCHVHGGQYPVGCEYGTNGGFLIAIGITVIVILRMVTIGSREFRNALRTYIHLDKSRSSWIICSPIPFIGSLAGKSTCFLMP